MINNKIYEKNVEQLLIWGLLKDFVIFYISSSTVIEGFFLLESRSLVYIKSLLNLSVYHS